MKIWSGEDTVGTDFYLVTNETIYIDDFDNNENEEVALDKLKNNESPLNVFTKDVKVIHLSTVSKISADIKRNEIEVTFKDGKSEDDATMFFSDDQSFQSAYGFIKNLFGEKFIETVDEYNIPKASYGSLWALTVFGFLTWLFYRMADQIEQEGADPHGRKAKLLVKFIDLLGTTGVAIIGGIILLTTLVYLISRIRKPPSYLVLHSGNYKVSGVARTIVNYVILIIVWIVLVKAML
ncbi:hypothetical protein [Zooshikella sp. RANM57]|uniref:hypothetical protein n=1 Tax=Zooshikella sp. RANM57 TaxID=3425863 RepID=UPI003D6F0D75